MSNKAAWSVAKGGSIKIDDAPMPKVELGHIVVKNAAVAINPVDWKMRDSGLAVKEWPTIFGCDVAGVIYAVGEGVTRFKKGDRVTGNCCRLLTGRVEEAGFQLYILVTAALVTPIPDEMSFEEASVIPLSISTAGAGLYGTDQLALPLPIVGAESSGGIIVIWGGSSSVGCSTIQLAKASGLEVIATASKHNFELVKSLGARVVFDHRSLTVVDEIVTELKGNKIVGCFDCVGLPETTKACVDILSKFDGHFVTSVGHVEGLPSNVKGGMVFAETIRDNFIGKAIYEEYLPNALKEKTFLPMPKVKMVGEGLESIETAIERSKKGVSASKLVVKL